MSEEKPQIWSVFAFFVTGIAAQVAIGLVLGVIALFWLGFEDGPPQGEQIEALMATPVVFLCSLVSVQLLLLVLLAGAVAFSSVPWRARLNMQWGHASPAWIPLWCLASLGTGTVGEMLVDVSQSPYAQQLKDGINSSSLAYGILIMTLGALLPGFIEEMIFRGYVQSRLLKRWPAWLAVVVSSIMFAAYHLDPLYVVAVLPIGLWLGFLAYRLGGTLPGIVCHIVNNFIAFGILILVGRYGVEVSDGASMALNGFLLACLGAAVLVLLLWLPGPQQGRDREAAQG